MPQVKMEMKFPNIYNFILLKVESPKIQVVLKSASTPWHLVIPW